MSLQAIAPLPQPCEGLEFIVPLSPLLGPCGPLMRGRGRVVRTERTTADDPDAPGSLAVAICDCAMVRLPALTRDALVPQLYAGEPELEPAGRA
jgi:hypothetical protein